MKRFNKSSNNDKRMQSNDSIEICAYGTRKDLVIHGNGKESVEAKYWFLINKRESKGLKDFNDYKAFIKTRMILMMFIKILKNAVQIKNVKYCWLYDCWYA